MIFAQAVPPISEIIPLPLVEMTPWGLLGLVFLFLITGRIVVKVHYDAIGKERDHWRETALTLMDTTKTNAETIRMMTESAEFQKKVMETLQNQRAVDGSV